MGAFHFSVAENMKSFKTWHDNKHTLTTWDACPHEPCNHMDAEFRRCWR